MQGFGGSTFWGWRNGPGEGPPGSQGSGHPPASPRGAASSLVAVSSGCLRSQHSCKLREGRAVWVVLGRCPVVLHARVAAKCFSRCGCRWTGDSPEEGQGFPLIYSCLLRAEGTGGGSARPGSFAPLPPNKRGMCRGSRPALCAGVWGQRFSPGRLSTSGPQTPRARGGSSQGTCLAAPGPTSALNARWRGSDLFLPSVPTHGNGNLLRPGAAVGPRAHSPPRSHCMQ